MRKRLITALFLLAATAGWAQDGKASRWSLTPHVGANLWMAEYNFESTTDRELGLTAGAELGYQLGPMVNVSLGVDYALLRFSMPITRSATVYQTIDHDKLYTVSTGRLCLPLQVGVRIWQGLSVRTGMQMGINLHTNEAEAFGYSYHYLSYPPRNVYQYHFDPIQWYIPIGLCYEYRQWVADFRFYYSLKRNHWKIEGKEINNQIYAEAWTVYHDRMLQLTLGYRFSL